MSYLVYVCLSYTFYMNNLFFQVLVSEVLHAWLNHLGQNVTGTIHIRFFLNT